MNNTITRIINSTTTDDFSAVAKLANIIWREHYIPIIGLEQVEYMLEKFQTVKAISEQIEHGFEYFTIFFEEKRVGYLSVQKQKESLFLSKIYILSTYRGKGVGSVSMDFITNLAREKGCSKIVLTVNKYNTNTIRVYQKLGFITVSEMVQDIGDGFVMDDFRLEKLI